jgi:Ca-activated chloride channel homolog
MDVTRGSRRVTGSAPAVSCGVALLVVIGALLFAAPARAQDEDEPKPALLLILDSSGSMLADDGTGRDKIVAAKEALNRVVDSLPDDSLVGLRVYGHRIPNTDKQRGCKDTELIAPVSELNSARMKERIRSFDAKGFTPIALSLKKGAHDLRAQEGKKTIVLVSDGIETCAPPPPCKVARQIVKQGIDLRIDTVGFQVDPAARRQLQCIARVGRGTYVDAGSADDLARQLEQISIRALRTYETAGTAISGAPDSLGAPEIAAGQFTDTISPGEELWYSVELAEGQLLDTSVTIVGDPASEDVGDAEAAVVTPELDETAADARLFGVGPDTVSGSIATPEVGTEFPFESAGTYFLKITLTDDSGTGAGREFPLELLVDVVGDPIVPSPDPTEEDPPVDSGDEPPAAAEDGADSDEAVTVVGGAAVSLLAGGLLGAFAVRRVRGGSRA